MEKKIYILSHYHNLDKDIIISSYDFEKVIKYARTYMVNNLGYIGYNTDVKAEYVENALNALRNDRFYRIYYLFEPNADIWRIEEIDVI